MEVIWDVFVGRKTDPFFLLPEKRFNTPEALSMKRKTCLCWTSTTSWCLLVFGSSFSYVNIRMSFLRPWQPRRHYLEVGSSFCSFTSLELASKQNFAKASVGCQCFACVGWLGVWGQESYRNVAFSMISKQFSKLILFAQVSCLNWWLPLPLKSLWNCTNIAMRKWRNFRHQTKAVKGVQCQIRKDYCISYRDWLYDIWHDIFHGFF